MEAVANAYAKVGLRAVIAPMVADLTFYQAVPGLIDALPDDARDRAGKMRMGGADATVAAHPGYAAQSPGLETWLRCWAQRLARALRRHPGNTHTIPGETRDSRDVDWSNNALGLPDTTPLLRRHIALRQRQ
jgi:hypothetical protein